MKKLRYGSVCSGIEAASEAWKALGWICEFVAEIEKFPAQVLKHHYPKVPNYGDITKFKEWPEHTIDVLVGGTPCQSFSVAGLREGIRDPRGNLALVFLAIADKYRPRWILWENVPGVHSSWTDEKVRPPTEEEAARLRERGLDPGEYEYAEQRNDFDCFLAGMEELGYGVATSILDAQFFGLAQRRERVFAVGHLGGKWQRAAAVLFDTACLRGDPAPRREKRKGASTHAGESAAGGRELGPTLAALQRGGGGLGTDAECDGGVIPIQEIGKRQSGTSMNGVGHGHPGDPMFTLQAAAVHGVAMQMEIAPCIDANIQQKNWCDQHVNVPPWVVHGVNEDPEVARAQRACHTASGRMDPTQETLISHAIPVEMQVCNTLKAEGFDGMPDGTGRGMPIVPVGFPGRQNPVHYGNQSGSLDANPHSKCVAFGSKDSGADALEDCSPTLRSGNEVDGNQNGGMAPAVAFQPRIGRNGRGKPEEIVPALNGANSGETSDSRPCIATGMQVRRLTPTECARLQGFPDDYLRIHDKVADGPMYKALGNSMAVPVMKWLGERIQLVDQIKD